MEHAHGSQSVVTLVVTMAIKPEHDADFRRLAERSIAKVLASEPGTVLYTLHRHPTAANTYVWVERFADAAAMAAHSGTPHMAEAMSLLPGYLASKPEVLELEQLAP